MFFPVSKNAKYLKMENLRKQHFPIHAQSSRYRLSRLLFCKDGVKGTRRGCGSSLISAQLFGEENQVLLPLQGWKLEARGGSGTLRQRVIPPAGFVTPGPRQVPKGHHREGGKGAE